MKVKIILFSLVLLLLASIRTPKIHAQEVDAGSSASLASFSSILVTRGSDARVAMLRAYLEKQDSPLAPYAETFVSQADLYNLDWRLVAAIAGRESSFAKQEPCINAWGYGIFSTQTMCFSSYDEGIRIISKDLREKFINRWGAENVWQIGKLYASSPTWASGVIYFMNDMQNFAIAQTTTQPLPISL